MSDVQRSDLTEPSSFELAVLAKFLAGDDERLRSTRSQLDGLRVAKRELTGVGFMTTFAKLGPPPQPGAGEVQFTDVDATIEGVEHGAGFVLYLTDGQIDVLEGYTYDEPWPNSIGRFNLTSAPDNTQT